ncbi:hypothetical protein ACIQU6_40065 [Streptomyces sp. NPDC090442]|uniref:hypothetical protein n=1 Tax=Streptomyces sp. NPDC090442 TaxID=3365962 RepID=UPI0038176E75
MSAKDDKRKATISAFEKAIDKHERDAANTREAYQRWAETRDRVEAARGRRS